VAPTLHGSGMTLMQVPVIDIAPFLNGDVTGKKRVAEEVGQACRDIGFLIISGHGVDPGLIARTDALSRQFFDLPLAAKTAVARPAIDVTRGYIPLEAEAVAASRGETTAADLNESFMIGPVDVDPGDPYYTRPEAGKHFHPNLWPAAPEGLRDAYSAYYRAMGDLAVQLMRIFALALDLPESFFDNKIDRHISRLRVRNYPEPISPPKPGQLRAGAHCDYGSLTILKAEANPGGLQVFNKNGEWVDVPIVPGAYIINLGELMARWTNDVWVSTLHRVVNPPADQSSGSRRQSIIFFHNPNYDAEIACIPSCAEPGRPAKYPRTTSGEHLRNQFVRTQAPAKIA
jgi:isopenicillin N synthase-like dioxygenase